MQRVIFSFLVVVAAVVSLSLVSNRIWGGKTEGPVADKALVFSETMTIARFGSANDLQPKLLKRVFGLKSQADRKKPIAAFGMSEEQVLGRVQQALAIQAEHASKNWGKIVAKFLLWFVFLVFTFRLMRRGRITAANRKWLLLISVGVFGVILGSDPSPMGAVKDAVVLLGAKGVIFPPRLIAFFVFVLSVILANKFICSWGCQLGTLQDAIFRFNRDSKDRKGLLKQYRAPFIVSNTFRVVFFVALTVAAFVWSTDIVEHIDPFKVFNPQVFGLAGIVFVGLILVMSLFVYRPWCHFFCPFGLAGWLAEKASIFKINVDYDKCVSCEACAKACPSTVMGAILRRDRVIPDCFSCGTCVEVCPEGAVSFKSGKRAIPPDGKFGRAEVGDEESKGQLRVECLACNH